MFPSVATTFVAAVTVPPALIFPKEAEIFPMEAMIFPLLAVIPVVETILPSELTLPPRNTPLDVTVAALIAADTLNVPTMLVGAVTRKLATSPSVYSEFGSDVVGSTPNTHLLPRTEFTFALVVASVRLMTGKVTSLGIVVVST